MDKINNRIIIPVVSCIIGIVWLVFGFTTYGFWDNKPGSGFFPAIIGTMLIIVSIIAIVQDLKKDSIKYDLAIIYPVLAVVGIILSSMLIGLVPAICLYVFGWLKFLEKYSWKFSILVTLILLTFIYGVFIFWLHVPFTKGLIYKLII